MLSINLENTKKELDEFKKYSYDVHSPTSQQTRMAKLDMDNSLSHMSSYNNFV
jgi:hypothetical protein